MSTPLFKAITDNDINAVKSSLAAGADIESRDSKKQRTPLSVAIFSNCPEIVELLISSGANVNAADKGGFSPLHCSMCNHDLSIVKGLVNAGAIIDAQDKIGYTPLHWSFFYDRHEHSKLLLRHGASLNIQSSDMATPLHAFAEYSNIYTLKQMNAVDLIQDFLQYTADPSIVNDENKTFMDCFADRYKDNPAELEAIQAMVEAKIEQNRLMSSVRSPHCQDVTLAF